MNQVAEILAGKRGDVLRIDVAASVFDAVKTMVEANVGSLLVTDGGDITGIVTERDYLRRAALEGRPDRETPVREIMSSPVICVTSDTDIEECMALMTDKHVRHLPVMDADRLIGILSIGDIVKAVISEKQFLIEQLENYISGGG